MAHFMPAFTSHSNVYLSPPDFKVVCKVKLAIGNRAPIQLSTALHSDL